MPMNRLVLTVTHNKPLLLSDGNRVVARVRLSDKEARERVMLTLEAPVDIEIIRESPPKPLKGPGIDDAQLGE